MIHHTVRPSFLIPSNVGVVGTPCSHFLDSKNDHGVYLHSARIQPTMTDAIRATISVSSPDNCPVADASRTTASPIQEISRAAGPTARNTVAEEFTVPADTSIDPEIAQRIFETDSSTVYRFERERAAGCVCERIEYFGCPVIAVEARDGDLELTFHAFDMGKIKEVIEDLMHSFEGVHVQQLHQGDGKNARELVLVDRSTLTKRQREVLETSFELGYFDHPRGANATDVANELGINRSTFREHLSAAQRKLLETILSH